MAAKTWIKWGCIGCSGVLGMILLFVGVTFGVAYLQLQKEEVVDQTFEPETPPATVRPEEAAPDEVAAVPAVGRVVIDVEHADLRISPAADGQGLSLEASYDQKIFELEEKLDERGEAGWSYSVRFRGGNDGLMGVFKWILGANQPKLHLYLPADVPIALELKLSEAESKSVELGGLWLTDADFEISQGGLELTVSEPTAQPLGSMRFDMSMGGLMAARLGNASPQRLEVEQNMAGMFLDLHGDWKNDSEVEINIRMAGANVQLPRNVNVEGAGTAFDGSARAGDAEIPRPTLRFKTSASMGEIEFDR